MKEQESREREKHCQGGGAQRKRNLRPDAPRGRQGWLDRHPGWQGLLGGAEALWLMAHPPCTRHGPAPQTVRTQREQSCPQTQASLSPGLIAHAPLLQAGSPLRSPHKGLRRVPERLHGSTGFSANQADGQMNPRTWGTPARSVKVVRTGRPAPADGRSNRGEGPRDMQVEMQVCPHHGLDQKTVLLPLRLKLRLSL